MFLITLSIRFIWVWLTTVDRFCETFKISINDKRNWKFFEMIFEIENSVFFLALLQQLFHSGYNITSVFRGDLPLRNEKDTFYKYEVYLMNEK